MLIDLEDSLLVHFRPSSVIACLEVARIGSLPVQFEEIFLATNVADFY